MENDYTPLPKYWELTPWEFAEEWGDGNLFVELAGKNPDGSQATMDMKDRQRDYYAFLSLAKSLKRIEEKLGTLPPITKGETN